MYHHVLVAVDGGACAMRALTEAIGLAAACRAQLEVVHVIDYSFLQYDSGYGIRADIIPELLEYGKNLLRDAAGAAEQAGVKCTTTLIDNIICLGDVAGQILEQINASHADVVVVGTHGRHGLRRVFLGSVAESLARSSAVPVLLVREAPRTHETAPGEALGVRAIDLDRARPVLAPATLVA